MHNVFFWVERSLRSYPWLVSNASDAELVFVNASFNPHDKKTNSNDRACRDAMQDALARVSSPVFGVSFHISGHDRSMLLRVRRNQPVDAWIVMEPRHPPPGTNIVIAPYVVCNKRAEAVAQRTFLEWGARKLLFFAAHIPKTYMKNWFGWRTQIRFNLWKELHSSPDVSIYPTWASCAPGRCDPLYYNHTSHRLSHRDYIRLAMTHRFCVVAPGDTLSTKKVAETVHLLALGGCVPLILGGVSHLPYSSWIKYDRLAVVAPPHDSRYDLDRLRRVGADAYRSMQSYAQSVVHHFVQDLNSSWSSPSAAETLVHETCHVVRKARLSSSAL